MCGARRRALEGMNAFLKGRKPELPEIPHAQQARA